MSPERTYYNQELVVFLDWFRIRGRFNEYNPNCLDMPHLECGNCLGIYSPGGLNYTRDNLDELINTHKCTCIEEEHIIPEN